MKKPTSLNPFFFTLFLYFNQSSCLHPSYEACVPKDCGNGLNITYPFFIKGSQKPFCGYPGFELSCNDSSPVLHISENRFIVRDIYYWNLTFRLLNAVVSPGNTVPCPSAFKNITLDPNRFLIDNATTSDLVLLSNCSSGLRSSFGRYRAESCGEEAVMLASDANLGGVKVFCPGVVVVPVDLEGSGRSTVVDGENYAAVIERGFMMRWLAGDCGVCKRSGGRCGFDRKAFQFRCFCPDRPHMVSCKSEESNRTPILIAVLAGSAFVLALIIVIFIICRVYKRKYFSSRGKSPDVEEGSVYFGVPVFTYTELEDATHHFDSSKELGDGGFGTVYYGKLRDGREVAVKRLYEHNYKRVQQFMNEVEILTRLRHRNLVLLYGCTSRRSRELLLVYEYISNGTVADHLHGEPLKERLTWPVRLKIAVETANALVYLHASEIIHRDVKTDNILLDHDFCVKVADFGLSRLLPNDVTHVSTAPQGTPGYVDPEYHQCYQLTEKSDVYSFGVVLIELISSMPAIDICRSRDEINLASMAINRIQRCAFDELIDPSLGSDSGTERMTTSVAELAFRCLQFDSDSRPTMSEVLEVLERIRVADCGDAGELPSVKPPVLSPENEGTGLLRNLMASPVSVTAKWHSNSSGATTPTPCIQSLAK